MKNKLYLTIALSAISFFAGFGLKSYLYPRDYAKVELSSEKDGKQFKKQITVKKGKEVYLNLEAFDDDLIKECRFYINKRLHFSEGGFLYPTKWISHQEPLDVNNLKSLDLNYLRIGENLIKYEVRDKVGNKTSDIATLIIED